MSKIYTAELVLTSTEKNVLISILTKYESTASVLQLRELETVIVESLLSNIKVSLVEQDYDEWRDNLIAKVNS